MVSGLIQPFMIFILTVVVQALSDNGRIVFLFNLHTSKIVGLTKCILSASVIKYEKPNIFR